MNATRETLSIMAWLSESGPALAVPFVQILTIGIIAVIIFTGAVHVTMDDVAGRCASQWQRFDDWRAKRREKRIGPRLSTLLGLCPANQKFEDDLRQLGGPLKVWITANEDGGASIMARSMDQRNESIAFTTFPPGSATTEILNAMALELDGMTIKNVAKPNRPASATLRAAQRIALKAAVADLARGYGKNLTEKAVGA